MSHDRLAWTIDIFTGRLRNLARLLDMAATQWRERGRDPETLLAGRLADDMFPLPHQVLFVCHQAKCLATLILEGPDVALTVFDPDPTTLAFADFAPLIDAQLARLDQARTGDPARLTAEKRVDLPHGPYLILPDGAYVDHWLVPNLYFHLVTAYDILRHVGVSIGKPDYMAHLFPYLRNMPAKAS